jgi:hypothetical protein
MPKSEDNEYVASRGRSANSFKPFLVFRMSWIRKYRHRLMKQGLNRREAYAVPLTFGSISGIAIEAEPNCSP